MKYVLLVIIVIFFAFSMLLFIRELLKFIKQRKLKKNKAIEQNLDSIEETEDVNISSKD